MVAIYEVAKRELGYNASGFLQMVSEQGGLVPAGQLLWSGRPSEGFNGGPITRLDLTVEAHVFRPEFAALFTEDDRERAVTGPYVMGFPVAPTAVFTGRWLCAVIAVRSAGRADQ